MSYHAVIAFPDDGEETLEKVLRITRTGAVPSPLDRCVTFAHDADAIIARMFGGRVVDDRTLILNADEEKELRNWMHQRASTVPAEWRSLERFEFFRLCDAERLFDAYEAATGAQPCLLPLDLWPEIFPLKTRRPWLAAAKPSHLE